MSKISVTTIAGLTSGGDANKVKIESGDTLEIVNGSQTINRTGNGVAQTIQNGGTTVGQIGVNSTDNMFLVSTNTGFKLLKDEAAIAPAQSGGSNHDNALDLGFSTVRWKDLYLSGGAFIGGATTANKLDDYEEGTFTPGILNGWGVTSPTYSQQTGFYTKIGNVCHVSFRIGLSGGSINGNRLTVQGFPFTAGSNTSGTLWTGNGYFSTAGSNAENVFLKIVDNGVYPSFHYRTGTGTAEFTGTHAAAGFNLTFSGSYFTT